MCGACWGVSGRGEKVMGGRWSIKLVCIYIDFDDVLVYGNDIAEHDIRLERTPDVE